jgi:hypothetical protein
MASITVTNESDDVNAVGSLRYELAHASAGDIINFAPSVTAIDLTSSLVISKNVTIEGAQPGATTPGVTIEGGGSTSNFSDFTINAGVTATLDGLVITGGNATGAAGAYGGRSGGTGGTGQGAGGAIYDAGTLTLTDTVVEGNSATGGAGGKGGRQYAPYVGNAGGGGAGGAAAGGIYVAGAATLNLAASDSFSGNSATGGAGGPGGGAYFFSVITYGGAGGAGGHSAVNDGIGQPGRTPIFGGTHFGGMGGAPGQPGESDVPGGGGGGGNAFANVGGKGTINGPLPVPCYCPGTRIRTIDGEKCVEMLEIGDEVTTASGVARPIKWIGRRSYGGRFIRGDKDILPICIHAGALDENVPKRDLWVSPHHAMYLDGILIEAKDLVNGASIVQAKHVEKVEYFHVELDTHDVIVAEGAPSETYLDDDNRLMFHNAQDYDARYRNVAVAPGHYCAPRLEDGYEVEAVRQRIAGRAGLRRSANSKRPTVKMYRRPHVSAMR